MVVLGGGAIFYERGTPVPGVECGEDALSHVAVPRVAESVELARREVHLGVVVRVVLARRQVECVCGRTSSLLGSALASFRALAERLEFTV